MNNIITQVHNTYGLIYQVVHFYVNQISSVDEHRSKVANQTKTLFPYSVVDNVTHFHISSELIILFSSNRIY